VPTFLQTMDSFAGSDMAPTEKRDDPAPVVPAQMSSNMENAPPTLRRDGPAETVTDPGEIEEGRDAYRPGGFHPVYIGDVYADRYEILNKIGYGVYSTVWLAKDLTKP